MKYSYKKLNKIALLLFLFLFTTNVYAGHGENSPRICTKTAKFLKSACDLEVNNSYLSGLAICLNITDEEQRGDCFKESRIAQREARKECRQVLRARKSLCRDIGQDPYDPPFGEDFADNFVNPLEIGKTISANPYFPLVTGNQWVYEGTSINDEGEEETETITVTVTDKTKLIDGITCVVVNDVAVVDGEVVENTDDWYAQDIDGNVWYCGEIAENFETFDGDEPALPELTDIDGSWKAGRDGAKAGILLPFLPQVGEVIRQEVAWGDAEDVIEILSLDGTESSPVASCDSSCLVTRDFTPLDSTANESKFYVPGVGLIVEIDLNTGERKVELIEFTNSQ